MEERDVWEMMDEPSRRGEFASLVRSGGFDVDLNQYRNPYFPGETIIRLAVIFGAEDVALALLERGADPLMSKPGVPIEGVPAETPFHRAIIGRMTRFVAACLDRDPSLVNRADRTGRPILLSVSGYAPDLELVRLLLSRGAELDFNIDKKCTFERFMKEQWGPPYAHRELREPTLKLLGYM